MLRIITHKFYFEKLKEVLFLIIIIIVLEARSSTTCREFVLNHKGGGFLFVFYFSSHIRPFILPYSCQQYLTRFKQRKKARRNLKPLLCYVLQILYIKQKKKEKKVFNQTNKHCKRNVCCKYWVV